MQYKGVLIIWIATVLLFSCNLTKKQIPPTGKRDFTYSCDDSLLVAASFECFHLMLLHDSLQVYYHLCLNELDSCKPTLFIDRTGLGNLWKKDIGPASEWPYNKEFYKEREIPFPVKFVYSLDIDDYWIDYWLFFKDLHFEYDSAHFEFEMRVMDCSIRERGGYRENPEFGTVHPRRRYPEIRVNMNFNKQDTIWKVTSFDLEKLPPYDSKMLRLGKSRIPRKYPRRYCVEQPIEVDLEEERRKMLWPLDSFWKDDPSFWEEERYETDY